MRNYFKTSSNYLNTSLKLLQKTAPCSNWVPHPKHTLRTTAEHQAEQSPRNTGQVAPVDPF